MKHLKRFNEAIIDYKSDNIEGFYNDCLDKVKEDEESKKQSSKKQYLTKPGLILPKEMKEIGVKYEIEVVDYNTFFNELSDDNKKGAPPRGVPAFALVNPDTNKPRVVYGVEFISKDILDHIHHMLKHENIHIGQKDRSGTSWS